MGNYTLKKRNGSLNLLLGKESDDTDLCQSSVVELLDKSLGLLLLGLLSGEAKGIEEVQRNRVGDKVTVSEVGEFTGLSSTHVVSSSGLTPPLKESNEEDDLPLGGIGEGIPLLRRRSGGVWVGGSVGRDGEGEVDSVGLNNVSCES